jgi:hypothetical protein
MDEQLLFTEEEWPAVQKKVVAAMTAYLRDYRAPIFEDLGDHGEGWGSGSYIQVGGQIFILTNEHVARAGTSGRGLIHQFNAQEDLRPILGDHFAADAPRDLALLPVNADAWRDSSNRSRAIRAEQLAWAHTRCRGSFSPLWALRAPKSDSISER